jgi:hypothetical protein
MYRVRFGVHWIVNGDSDRALYGSMLIGELLPTFRKDIVLLSLDSSRVLDPEPRCFPVDTSKSPRRQESCNVNRVFIL